VWFGVVRFAGPAAGGKDSDAGQVGSLAVVHHGGQPQIGRIDVDAGFLGRFAGRAVGQCLGFVEVSAWEVEHPVAVPGALALQKEYLLPAFEDDVYIDDRPVALGRPSSRWLVTGAGVTVAFGWRVVSWWARKSAWCRVEVRIATVDTIMNALDDARHAEGLSKAELARAIGAEPAAVRRLFAAGGDGCQYGRELGAYGWGTGTEERASRDGLVGVVMDVPFEVDDLMGVLTPRTSVNDRGGHERWS
jgi:hypothetical protein